MAAELDHDRIRPLLPREPGLGWICGPRGGIGPTEFPDPSPSFHQHLARIIKNKTVESVIVACDIAQIAAQGMPAQRPSLTIFIGDSHAQPAWTTVLQQHSDQTIENSELSQLPNLIAPALTALPMA